MAESNRGARVRVSVSTTSKGVPSYDCTIELWGQTEGDLADVRAIALLLEAEAVDESDRLYAKLKARYSEPGWL